MSAVTYLKVRQRGNAEESAFTQSDESDIRGKVVDRWSIKPQYSSRLDFLGLRSRMNLIIRHKVVLIIYYHGYQTFLS